MELDYSQKKFCLSNSENIRLLAPAGSGKTLSLLWRCKYLYEKRENKNIRFLVFTFTRVARDELKDVLANNSDFSEIKKVVRIETLNKWGLNYLRNSESGLEVKSGKRDFYFLVKNTLRPIWVDNSKLSVLLQKKQFKYDKIIQVFDALKSSGFRHDAKNLVEHFDEQHEWLIEQGCERYVQRNILQPLEELGFIQNSEGFGGKIKLFLDF